MVGLHVGLDSLEHFLFYFDELQLLFIRRNEFRKGMLANHTAVSIANKAFEALFRSIRGAAEAREKELRIVDLPASVNHYQQFVTIGGQHLLELAFEVTDALIELVDILNGRG